MRQSCYPKPDLPGVDGGGESFHQGERLPTAITLERVGIPVPGLWARDDLAAINGSNLITGIAALLLHDAESWVKQAESAVAGSLEVLLASMRLYLTKLHDERGFPGAQQCAMNLRRVMDGSDLVTGKLTARV